MSFTVSKKVAFTQNLEALPHIFDIELALLGGVLSDARHVWQAKGPYLEVRDTKLACKIGGWTFGCILKDSNTKVVCVEELQGANGGPFLLVVALECTISGGIVCLFNPFISKVIRAIQIKEKISSMRVVDPGVDVLNLPGALRDFDGILAIGTVGGSVLLTDICRQICEELSVSHTIRDELCPSQLIVLTPNKVSKIEQYREKAVNDGSHIAIHLNIVLDNHTEHFTLKGPQGEDRIHVNKEEVAISALYFCPQLTSLLLGFNFGAFQLWDLTTLKLIYTSPICDEHIPITHFTLQEPTDDPRAFCYIWASYSSTECFQNGLPFAVMYSVCYENKEYHEGYGYLYQNFQYCAVRFQVELGALNQSRTSNYPRGGHCLGLQAVSKLPANKDSNPYPATGDTLTLCVISWSVWYNQNDVQSNTLIFDLNQWYKEQMPNFSKWSNCGNYIIKTNLNQLVCCPKRLQWNLLDVKLNPTSLRQFVGIQRLEEHFCPTSLTFDLILLRSMDFILIHNEGSQRLMLQQIQTAEPLCLIRPGEIYQKILSLGLSPLFVDITNNVPISIDYQRETILNVALEHHLIDWLCNCASEWANGRFSSAGCSLEFLLNWAFQRAVVLKTNCDKYCAPLFDYSRSHLDHNTSLLLNSCIGQINVLCKFYFYVINNLSEFISYSDTVLEQYDSLEMVAMYFEVLQWLVNVGLLPECPPAKYPRPGSSEKIRVPYPVRELTEYYNEKRAHLQLLSKERFASSDSLLFIDNLINNKCGAEQLQKQWQEDGGFGLYPPPSLQSLLRTYLIPGTSICHKHSLVIYLFLDLAMALDQCQYSSVITYLIKFPAVFKVTPSIIKITQAFWQLDHGDYNTAIELLLDPFVLGKDLQQWHHTIAMRSLLLQDQHNTALLYMQVRNPPVTDDKDIFTALSLFITNNMVSEAFQFMKQQCHNDEEKFLMHLLNECNKNECLHVLLYKCLNANEERAFLKYLSTAENPSTRDLQVFYFLLRSRFVEAFDVYSNLRKEKPERLGLVGQRNATKTDQIVKLFKSQLPDVNRNLVDYVRKERSSIWKEVVKVPMPTPLSVFVHNTQEQVRYKSTMIHAAISKAKGTFDESININNRKPNEVVTEETPFLKTPTAFRSNSRYPTPVITPKVMELDENGEEVCPTPSKRLRLSPRSPTKSPRPDQSISMHAKMLTPIVKRKTSLDKEQSLLAKSDTNICTPQSILKVRNLVKQGDSLAESTICDREDKVRHELSSRYSFGLQPRRSLSRTQQHVQFEDAALSSFSLSDQSSNKPVDNTTFEDQSLQKSLSSREVSLLVSSKNNSTTTTEEFYSPSTSVEDSKTSDLHKDAVTNDSVSKEQVPELDLEAKDIEKSELRVYEDNVMQSPRARRSYKRPFREMSPVRSSLRLSNKLSFSSKSSADVTEEDTSSKIQEQIKNDIPCKSDETENQNGTESSESSFISSPRILQKVKSRRSLSRQVLENNAFSKLPPPGRIISTERSVSKTEKTTVTERSVNSSKSSVMEASHSLSDTSTSELDSPLTTNKRISSFSASETSFIEASLDSESYEISEYSFRDEPAQKIKLPDSLIEYMNTIKAKIQENKVGTSQEEREEQFGELKEDSKHDQIATDRECSPEKVESKNVEAKEEIEGRSSPDRDEEQRLVSQVYADLSSGEEDIAEVLEASRKKAEDPQSSDVARENDNRTSLSRFDLAFCAEESAIELSESRLSEHETGFIAENSVVLISSEEEGSDKDNQNESSSSGEHDTSNEGNIRTKESSGSSTTADSTTSSEESSADEEENQKTEPQRSESANGEHEHKENPKSPLEERHDLEPKEPVAETSEVTAVSDSDSKKTEMGGFLESPLISGRNINNEPENAVEDVTAETQDSLLDAPDFLGNIPFEDRELVGDALFQEMLVGSGGNPTGMIVPSEVIPRVAVKEPEGPEKELVVNVTDRSENIKPYLDENKSLVEEPVEALRDQSTSTTNLDCTDDDGAEKTIQETEEKELVVNTAEAATNMKRHLRDEDESLIEIAQGETDLHSKQNEPTNTTKLDCTNVDDDGSEKTIQATEERQLVVNTVEAATNTTRYPLEDESLLEIVQGETDLHSKQDQATNTTTYTALDHSKADESVDTTRSKEEAPALTHGLKGDSTHEEVASDKECSPKNNEHSLAEEGAAEIDKEIVVGDQNTSSSNTEGDTVRQEMIVTAQIHTPGKRKMEEPLFKRVTRGSSTFTSSQDERLDTVKETKSKERASDNIKVSIDLETTPSAEDVTLPAKRTRRSLSSSPAQRPKPIKTRRSSHSEITRSDIIDCGPSSSKEIVEDRLAVRLLRRARGSSVNNVKTYLKKSSLTISSSEESTIVKETKPKSTTKKASSVVEAPVTTTKRRRRTSSALENYTTSRRLTRKQANIIKGVTSPIDVTEDNADMEETVYDPIKLLDKESFRGKPDPEEQKIYETSPSNSTISSFTKPQRRASRSASNASETSTGPTTPKKPTARKARSETDSPSTSAMQTRSRKQSETSSIVSDRSDSVTPPKRTRKKSGSSDEVGSTVSAASRTTRRSRTSSVKSSESITTSANKSARRRIVFAKSDLPEIEEENGNEMVETKSKPSKKRTKKQ